MIRLESVDRTHGADAGRVHAVVEIDLTIERGEFVAVAGPSGSGKTTLLNMIGAIDRPDAGRLLLDGHELGALSESRLAQLRLRTVGFIFQHFNLVPVLSARENVELPLLFRSDLSATARAERVTKMLDRVGMTDRSRHRPAELSGGERQRVAIARALAGEPSLVLADEPTANLDRENGTAVIRLMQELNRERGTTFLYATHDDELIRLADRVLWMRDGRIIEGAP